VPGKAAALRPSSHRQRHAIIDPSLLATPPGQRKRLRDPEAVVPTFPLHPFEKTIRRWQFRLPVDSAMVVTLRAWVLWTLR
jgi:hypothetical protein